MMDQTIPESAQERQGPNVSVVLPVYEEAETIRKLVPGIILKLEGEGLPFEVVTVDDGSRDETLEVLRDLKESYPERLRIARHLYNKGNGSALRTGTRIARGEIIVYMDSDGQHWPEEIPKLLSQIPPYDLVIGYRTKAYQGKWYRNVANRFYNRFASWLSGTEVKDLTSGYRAMRRSVGLHFLHLYPSGFSASSTVTLAFLKAGYNVSFVPITVQPRTQGKSKIRLWNDGTRFVLIILRMIMLYDPLRIFLPVGIVLAALGVLAWVAGLVDARRLILPNSAIFLFISALLTWLLGLVSGQISSTRVYYHGDETIIVEE
jgi:glycosyltransferase involved in cell wall biosynthesis